MKKFLSLFISAVLAITLFVPAFGEGTTFSTLSGTNFAQSLANAVENDDYTVTDGDSYVLEVNSANGFVKAVELINARIAAGKTKSVSSVPVELRLNADLDFAIDGEKTQIDPINKNDGAFNNFIFDGQGHTIKNYKIIHTARYYVGLVRHANNSTFKNLTITDAYVEAVSAGGAAALLGMGDGTIVFGSITVTDSTIRSFDKVAGIYGFESGEGATQYFLNCHVSDLYLFGAGHMGGIAGLVKAQSKQVVSNIDAQNVYFGLDYVGGNQYLLDVNITCPEGTKDTHPYCLGEGTNLTGYYRLNYGYY